MNGVVLTLEQMEQTYLTLVGPDGTDDINMIVRLSDFEWTDDLMDGTYSVKGLPAGTYTLIEGKKGKRGGKMRRGMLPGGMSLSDLRHIQDMMDV